MISSGAAHHGPAACLGDDHRGRATPAFVFPANYIRASGPWSIVGSLLRPTADHGARPVWLGRFPGAISEPEDLPGGICGRILEPMAF